MMAEVRLLDDCPATVTVGAAHLALRHLSFQVGDRALPAGELHHTGTLDADVIEVQYHRIPLAAVDARRVSKVVEAEEEVAAP
jgi:hypothetical protein